MSDHLEQAGPATEAEQVNQVVKWLLTGAQSFDVFDAIKKTYPKADPGSLVMLAMRHFEDSSQFQSAVVVGWCFEATRDLYRRMVEIGDYPGALRAVKQIADIARANVHNGREEEAEGRDEIKAAS